MGLFDRLRRNDGPRVAFIGIDGVPFSLIENHPDIFQHIHSLMKSGTGGPIDSIVPPESSACWPSLTTGCNPGKTGVYGFQDREIGSYETYVPMGQDVQAKRVWDYVHDADRKATVMNVPVTAPPQRNIQRMVSGFLSRDVETAAHPTSFARRLQELGYRIDVDAQLGHQADKTAFVADAQETLEARKRAFLEYIKKDDWDLFFGVFMTTDRINHFLFEDYEHDGEYRDEFLSFYQQLDDAIGELIQALPDEVTTILASDHGFTTLSYEVHCNRWLADMGLLSFQSSDHAALPDIADETVAYSLIPGRFYLNLDGREPRGTVPREAYADRIEQLQDELEALCGPDGEPVIDRVVLGKEIYAGDHDVIAPDVVALPCDGFDLKAGFGNGSDIFDRGPRNGMHTFANATFVTDDSSLATAETDLYDIAPTILDLMDIDAETAHMDGQSLC